MVVKSIQLNTVGRILIIVAIIFCGLAAYYITKLGFGHTIAQYTTSKEVAEYAIELAPYDASTYHKLASLNEKSFLAGDWIKSLEEHEKAVSMSPHDFRLWLAL